MNSRLSPQPGEWIDRSQPVHFQFEGREYSGFRGDVLSSALWASQVRMTGRSFKYHRPRGAYSLANHDVNTMVADARGAGSHRTHLRGDELALEGRLDLGAVNTWGSLRGDRWRMIEWFSAFMPVGFYYKTFFRPRWMFGFYERQMRKVAGLGRITPVARTPVSPKDYASCDLLVVGAGLTGLTAALVAADLGVKVVLVEQDPHLGGSGLWQHSHGEAENLSELIAKAHLHPGIEVRADTVASGWYTDHWVALVDKRKLTKLRARAFLAATGAIDQPAIFGNNDLPGVMLGSAAQRLIHLYAVKPFDRCVVLGANRDGYRVALDLAEAGVKVAALVDLRHGGETTSLHAEVARAQIPILAGRTVYESLPSRGKTGIKGARVCAIDSNGAPLMGHFDEFACDGIAVSVGWAPAAGLIYQAGIRFKYAEGVEQLVPRTAAPGVFAAGRVNGLFDPVQKHADAHRAALGAAKYLGCYDGAIPDAVAHVGPPPSHPYPIFSHSGKKNFVDFDEDVHLADIVNAHQEGYDNIELLKRYTTVGMGPSQGKLSNMNAVRILARLNGKSINQTGTTTSRPFHHPVPISHLAGRRFHPMRHTPIHDWHAELGAVFFHAGSWYRPEYYQCQGHNRDDCILAEATDVRHHLGLIDVSTLGKLYVCGADAVDFLEQIYAGRFAKLKVGRYRYGVACDESGVVIEDGVIARLAEDRFYVTATSSGVDAFYREMQRWALLWGAKVTLINVTADLAAMNLAGPASRRTLAPLTDLDLSAEAFGYVTARRGLVADVPATVMRVGFVGELGYEVHVPASSGLHVWRCLLAAGAEEQIRPFGVEAQRLLRLEKGHLIVGQDTDALTNPHEADVGWAIGKDKDFFVGQRSVDVMTREEVDRKLVGIRWDEGFRGLLPQECHLIIQDGRIAGRITSMAARSTLGYPLGMALVHRDLAKPGTQVTVRVENEQLVPATIVSLPFYDPDNLRQKQ